MFQVLEQCYKHGINIATTVCDMNAINQSPSALAILGATTSSPCFEINNKKIVTLFDAPHLIKCFRNLFLKYNIETSTSLISSDGKRGAGKKTFHYYVQ